MYLANLIVLKGNILARLTYINYHWIMHSSDKSKWWSTKWVKLWYNFTFFSTSWYSVWIFAAYADSCLLLKQESDKLYQISSIGCWVSYIKNQIYYRYLILSIGYRISRIRLKVSGIKNQISSIRYLALDIHY